MICNNSWLPLIVNGESLKRKKMVDTIVFWWIIFLKRTFTNLNYLKVDNFIYLGETLNSWLKILSTANLRDIIKFPIMVYSSPLQIN